MPLQLTQTSTRINYSTRSPICPLKRPEGRAPAESSVRSEIFAATRAAPFPSPVGAASSAGRGIHAASPHANQHAQIIFNALVNSRAEAG